MTVVEELRAFALFADLTDEQLAEWAEITEIRNAPADEVLLEERAESSGPLLLFEGTAMTSQGSEALKVHEAPTWIGTIAAITEDPMPVRVTAQSECRVAILPRDEFIALTLRYPSVHRNVMLAIGPVNC